MDNHFACMVKMARVYSQPRPSTQFCVISFSRHALNRILRTRSSQNWKLMAFDLPHPTSPSPRPWQPPFRSLFLWHRLYVFWIPQISDTVRDLPVSPRPCSIPLLILAALPTLRDSSHTTEASVLAFGPLDPVVFRSRRTRLTPCNG